MLKYSTLKANSKIADVDELKTRLIDECRAQFDQLIVDAASRQWRCRLSACDRVRGANTKLRT